MAFIPTLPTHLSTIHSHARIQSTPRYRIPLSIFPIRRAIIPAMTLSEGQTVPNFSQVATGGQTITQADISSGKVVVYFYPRDATPGCTTEAQDFRDMKQELANLQTKVYGISKDSIESHEQFVKDQSINFPLISDDGTLCEAFGVWKVCFLDRRIEHV